LQLAHWFLRRRFLCEFPIGSYVKLQGKFGCGGHLGRRAKLPDKFLEENHPMTISSKFSSNIEQMVSDKKIFMGISHRVLHCSMLN
jgi:hypothetical protein